MKHIKKLSALLMCVLIALSACLTASAANEAIKPTGDYTLNINLYESADKATQDLNSSGLTNGNGETAPTGTGFKPSTFNGVKFNIYNANATRNGSTGGVIGTATTIDGVATYKTTIAGTYWVELDKSSLPKEVAAVLNLESGFAVDLPMTNAAGTGWLSTVNVYPKVDTVWGIANFKKVYVNEKGTTIVLPSAKFTLYRTDITQDMIDAATTSYDQLKAALNTVAEGNWAVYVSELTSGPDGKFNTDRIPYGAYKLVETTPPKGYALNKTPRYFIIDGLKTTHNIANVTTNGVTYTIGEVNIENEKFGPFDKRFSNPTDETASIGDIVSWVIDYKVPSDAGVATYKKYEFTDIFDPVFSYLETTVKVNNNTVNGVAEYDESTRTLTVNLLDEINESNANAKILITISATLNADVRLLSNGIRNIATLTYDNGAGDVKADDNSAFIKTGGYTFKKVGSDTGDTGLAGAQFKVYKSDDTPVTEFYTNADLSSQTPDGIVTSDKNGLVHIYGLDHGDYYLVEVKAPDGYELNGEKINFTINYNTTDTSGVVDATITNKKKVPLPFTGGVGAEVVVASGVLLMVAACFVLKKRVK